MVSVLPRLKQERFYEGNIFIKDKRKYLHGVVLAFAALAAGLFLYFISFITDWRMER